MMPRAWFYVTEGGPLATSRAMAKNHARKPWHTASVAHPAPGELLRRYGLSPRKSWGQNFLHDPTVLSRIAGAAALGQDVNVIEIGAGLGALTARLLASGANVHAIERDRDMCHVLRSEFGTLSNFTLHEADAVRFDYTGIENPVVVGNLPYHLTAPLLFGLLEVHAHTQGWIVMVQLEVAKRLAAAPGSRTYGIPSILLGRCRTIDKLFDVPPGAFLPAPRVRSAVLRLLPRPQPLGEAVDPAGFAMLVRAAFAQRRKTLLNSLSTLASKSEVVAWCMHAQIDPGVRPEQLDIPAFTRLQQARAEQQRA